MSNDLIPTNATMTSLEIAELTGKQHGHVVRDLKELEKQGVIGLSSFGETSKDSQNKSCTIYRLPKRETLILTSGYSAAQRADCRAWLNRYRNSPTDGKRHTTENKMKP